MAIVIMIVEQFTRILLITFVTFDVRRYALPVNDYKNYSMYELEGASEELLKAIIFLTENDACAVYEIKQNVAHLLVSPKLKSKFKKTLKGTRLKVSELFSDYSKVIAAEKKGTLRDGKFSWDAYYNIYDIYTYLTTMQSKFPTFAKVVDGGHSFEGQKILGLKIVNGRSGSKQKPIVFVEAGIHAREWIAPASATYLIDQILTTPSSNMMHLRDNFEWHIFPVVNPDGYIYSYNKDRMWRKSRSKTTNDTCFGVDLNRNFDYNFGGVGVSWDPCDYQMYCGKHAFSEVETRTLSNYVLNLKNVISYIGVHSYASAIIIPHSDSKLPIPDHNRFVEVVKKAASYAFLNSQNSYSIGTAAGILSKITGASLDWAYASKKVPLSLVVELTGSNFTWPAERIPELGGDLTQMIYGMLEAAKDLKYY